MMKSIGLGVMSHALNVAVEEENMGLSIHTTVSDSCATGSLRSRQ